MATITSAEALAAALVARIAGITRAQSAETDIGLRVYQGVRHISDNMVPCAVISEGPDQPERNQHNTRAKMTQQFAILAYLPCDPLHPNVAAHAAIRDIKRAVFRTDGKPDWTWGFTTGGVQYRGREIGPRTDGLAFVVAAVEIEVMYAEDLANP